MGIEFLEPILHIISVRKIHQLNGLEVDKNRIFAEIVPVAMSASPAADLTRFLADFVSAKRRQRVEQVLAERSRYLTVVLEDIYQAHNASAVLRSCECFGVQDVHIIENRNSYTLNPDVVQGASKWLDLIRYNEDGGENSRRCLEGLRTAGYRLVAATPNGSDYTLKDLPVDRKTALMFGTEEHGLTPYALDSADLFVQVPMYGFTESFNISVCAALMLQEVSWRMREADTNWPLTECERAELRLDWYRKMVRGSDLLEQRFAADSRAE